MALLPFTFVLILSAIVSSERFGYRRDVKYLTEAEKEEMKLALYAMKSRSSQYNSSLSSYDYFPFVHAASVRIAKSHQTWAFLPWHRAFIYLFEEELNYFMNRSDDNPFKLPYWNPLDDESTVKTLFDPNFLGGTGDPNSNPPHLVPRHYAFGGVQNFPLHPDFSTLTVDPFDAANTTYNYPSLARWIFQGSIDPNSGVICGKQRDDESIWNDVYSISEYDVSPYNSSESIWDDSYCARSFRAQLEGCNPDPENYNDGCATRHSILHRIIGGHQMAIPWSPNDPLFFMLHTYIDLVWAKWQDIHDKQFNNFPQHVLNEPLFYFVDFNDIGITSADVLDTRDLFYKYDQQDTQSSTGDKEWYGDWSQGWLYLLILSILVVVGIVCYVVINYRKNKSEIQQSLYQNVELDDKEYGTAQTIVK